jgi:hypothetical protein
MKQFKHTLSLFMAAIFIFAGTLDNITVKAAQLVSPIINYVGVDHLPLVVGETEKFAITSKYDGQVQYRAFLFDGKTWGELTNGYGVAVDAKTLYLLPETPTFKLGNYKLSVWVKRAGTTGYNSKGYDTYYVAALNCVTRDVYVSGAPKVEANGLMIKDASPVALTSVKAINGKQVEIKFNKAVNRASAEKVANYKISDEYGIAMHIGKLVYIDSKTIRATLAFDYLGTDVALNNSSSYKLTVSNELVDAYGYKQLEDLTTNFTFTDTTIPVVTNAIIGGPKSVLVYFNEPVKNAVNTYRFVLKQLDKNGMPMAGNLFENGTLLDNGDARWADDEHKAIVLITHINVNTSLDSGARYRLLVNYNSNNSINDAGENESYTVKDYAGHNLTSNSIDLTYSASKETKLAVTSVSAMNATQVLVSFNKEVDKTDAETVARYQIGSVVATPVLQADKKSVLLTTKTPISGTNLYTVKPVKAAVNIAEKSAIFTKTETYVDIVLLKVVKIEYAAFDKATITFSEPISSLGNVTFIQNGAPVALPTIKPFVIGSTSVTYDLTKLVEDKPVSVVMVGTKDMLNNLITPNPTTITLKKSKIDTTAPTVSAIDALSDTRLSITFSEKIKAAPIVKIGLETVKFAARSDGITWTGTIAIPTTGLRKVAITAFEDVSSNAGKSVTISKEFAVDNTAPVLIRSEAKVFNSKLYLVLHYLEDVDAVPGGKIIQIGRFTPNVGYQFTTVVPVTPLAYTKANGADADDTKTLMLDISDDTMFPLGEYSGSLPTAFVQDKATIVNTSMGGDVRFRKEIAMIIDGLPSVSPNNKTLTVHYSQAVDYATALNIANYTVNGEAIFKSAIFDGDDQTVALTIAPGTITYSGDRLVSISGVKNKVGYFNTAYSSMVEFKENITVK